MVVAFIGSGNMAAAMARGWSGSAAGSGPDLMLFTDSGSGRAADLAQKVGGERLGSNREAFERADLVVLAVKPAGLAAVAEEAGGETPVLSILGGTPVERVAGLFPGRTALRAMPNLAVELGRGVLCLTAAEGADPAAVDEAAALLEALGRVERLPDSSFDAATAVMGCSPAYLALVMGAIADAGAVDGLDARLALSLTADAAAGTAALLASRSPEEIRRAVASKGGSTEAGLEVLDREGVAGTFAAAVKASLERMKGQ